MMHPDSGGARRRRILLIAEAANPEWASVPLVGWSLARALMERHDAMLVTQVRNRDAILRAGLCEGSEFICIDNEYIARRTTALAARFGATGGKGWTIGAVMSTLAYYEFERLIWRQLGADIEAGRFEIVHRITPLSPVTPSLLARKCSLAGVPFVVGPLNGGVPWPKEFRRAQHREREWLAHFRGVNKLLPGYQSMRRYASAIIVGSKDTMALESAGVRAKCFYLPENAVAPERFNRIASLSAAGPLRVCFVGRLVPYKGCDMLLDAMAPLLANGSAEVDVVGDGPMKEELVARFGRYAGVRFHGWVAHTSVQDILCEAHLLGFPSIREFGGGVVLEAMALGVPPVVVDYAGPGELVDDAVGYKVAIGSRQEVVAQLTTLLGLLADPSQREGILQRGVAARARVESYFTWQVKAEQISRLYTAICTVAIDALDRNLLSPGVAVELP